MRLVFARGFPKNIRQAAPHNETGADEPCGAAAKGAFSRKADAGILCPAGTTQMCLSGSVTLFCAQRMLRY